MLSNVIKSGLKLPALGFESVSQLLVQRLSRSPNTIQIIDTATGRHTTRGQILDYGLNFAAYLRDECRIGSGDVVLFVTQNSDTHAIALCGVVLAAEVYASIPVHSTARELEEVLDVITPTLLVLDSTNYEAMAKIGLLYGIKTLVLDKHESHTSIEDIFLKTRATGSSPSLPVPTTADTIITYVMTSGSTGRPKAVRRTNGNHLAVVAAFGHRDVCPLTPTDVLLSCGLCHICGQRSLLSAVESGACLAVLRCDENHDDVFATISKYRVTDALLVPTQLNYLVKNWAKFPPGYFATLKHVLTGAAPLTAATYDEARRLLPDVRLRNSYGMSESGFALTVHSPDAHLLTNCETVGKANPGMQIVVIDENGVPLGANQLGVICMKGDQVTPGYVNNSRENERLFTGHSYLRSGDIGYYDDNHYFYIIGRIKEMIIVDGVNIALAELERLLTGHKSVVNAAVIAVSDDGHGEVPMAFVTVVEGSDVTEQELIAYVNGQVNEHKKLRGGLRIVDKFPTTPSGKIKKPQLLASIVF
ncbi:unnamed protein product [Medioppia subpectinata]|uniref:Uncharacterized protein n=1 Tax=Medioppia subpectinata TaxID=1979941 RepID=A0A7R9L3X6_9ACAR|nr:unnamed protein product [Medioppia subpectinata]CAG2114800.1 unnamed protein product [Medioppia subpectinata]